MIDKSNNFKVIKEGAKYSIPNYTVTPSGIELTDESQDILFIRSAKPKIRQKEVFRAIAEVNRLAPYLGLGTFDTKTLEWLPSNFMFTVLLGPDFQLEYTHLYNTNKDIINKYMSQDALPSSQDGITHEQLLGMMIYDLNLKNKEVPSRETSIAITKLEEALHRLQDRQRNIERAKGNCNSNIKKEVKNMKRTKLKPLYRTACRPTYGHFKENKHYRHIRNKKKTVIEGEESVDTDTKMVRQRKDVRQLDFTPLYKYLQSKVGEDYDTVYSNVVERIPRNQRGVIDYIVMADNTGDGVARLGESTYFRTLYVDENNKLQFVNKDYKQTVSKWCYMDTTTLDGKTITETTKL